MPTYEYECQECGFRFERFQNMTDEPIKRCPKCNGHVKRLIGPGAGIIFKGSGFYATDYRSKSYKAAAEKEKRAEKETKLDKSSSDSGSEKKKEGSKKAHVKN